MAIASLAAFCRPVRRTAFRYLALVAAVLIAGAAGAADVHDVAAVPKLPSNGRDDYRLFLGGEAHRAFAVAPGGAWGWKAGADTAAEAGEAALATCRRNSPQKCVLYAVDDRVVFDAAAWPHLWGPYTGAAEANKAVQGRLPGQRFPDLAFSDGDGHRHSLAALRGKVVVLHFWGSWCPPCRAEMPDLQRLYQAMADRRDVAFVLLQAREPFATAKAWAAARGLHLPLFDSGASGESDAAFRLAGGGTIGDREIARFFPSTYVIDKRGIVVFAHNGAVDGWLEYRPFLIDAVTRSGR